MANNTSGTTIFEKGFSISDIIEESYQRIGLEGVSGNQLRSARRSLNILFQEWGNASSVDTPLTKISRSTYQALSNKTSEGQPTQYFVQRFIDKITVTLYLTPGTSEAGNFLNYYYVKRIQDAGDYSNDSDVPYRFVPCMVAGLAYYLAVKFAPDRIQVLKMLYEDELNRALTEDGSSSSSFITPKTYYPNI